MISDITKHELSLWILQLLASASKSGITPITKSLFHSLFFLSNILSPLYEMEAPFHLVMKYRRGPFYPDAQRELDMLTISGLIDIKDLSISRDKHGAWTLALYSLTAEGLRVLNGIKPLAFSLKLSNYLDDVCYAYSDRDNLSTEKHLLQDETYSKSGAVEKAVLHFENTESNKSLNRALGFKDIMPDSLTPSEQDLLRIYAKYLELKAA